LLIILNDNDMAIDHNVGGLNSYLVNITTSRQYNSMRNGIYQFLKKLNLIGDSCKGSILRFNNSLKSLLSKQQNIFEGLNIRYFGQADGHDVENIVRILQTIKDMKGPKILHLCTKKGKGYKPAEESPTIWHAPGKFNKETGEIVVNTAPNQPCKFQDVFGHTLVELAEKNERIVSITPAMPTGSSMNFMMERFPKRSFDVGISEEHAVTFSAGLAKEGLQPFCCIYSSFLQRAYDEIIHDVAIQNLPVTFCIDRAGIVGEDGVTHHGCFDLSFLRGIPNMTIAAPMDEHTLRHLLYTAQATEHGPFAIRYPRGGGEIVDWRCPMQLIPVGKGRKLNDGDSDIAILSIGNIGTTVTKAIKQAQSQGINAAHYDMIFLKPIDEDILREVASKYNRIITVENGTVVGGLGSAVMEWMNDNGYSPRIKRVGIPDSFIAQGTVAELHKICGMDTDSIATLLTTKW
ncbi:MAG: 1-deoxy-D-xylulose-5-phosphate synthase, partial [Bacteroidales bacterium]|nr:1-deoxy-D-xylulose-5-phosphate synthase [Bacteroidales bacterium]